MYCDPWELGSRDMFFYEARYKYMHTPVPIRVVDLVKFAPVQNLDLRN